MDNAMLFKKLSSPLNAQSYEKIEYYFQQRRMALTSAHPSVYENIDTFKAHFSEFDGMVSNLTEKEKIRAWFQLYGKTKKVVNERLEEANKTLSLKQPIKPKKKITFIHIAGVGMAAAFGIALGISSNHKEAHALDKQIKAEQIASQEKADCVNRGMIFYSNSKIYDDLEDHKAHILENVTKMCSNNPRSFK